MSRRLSLVVVLLFAAAAAAGPSAADLTPHIDSLSAFDYSTRMNAARMLRRAPAADAVPALAAAARRHPDQFVRYRALVLLTSFNDPGTPDLMRSLIADRNDRVREVAYRWFERHPDEGLTLPLLAALETEQAEFVRPALVRAVAALPGDEAVQRALVAEIGRGFDFFRSAVIDVLGQRRAVYAVDAIAAVAASEGVLQDDAILALGRIGDRRAVDILSSVKSSPGAVAALDAAKCMLGDACAQHIARLVAAARNPSASPQEIRSAATALSAMSEMNLESRAALLTLAGDAPARLQHEVALALAASALQQPAESIEWASRASETDRTFWMALLREGFQSLEEDFAEEQFFAVARAAYWKAGDASGARGIVAALIDRLEF